MAKTITDITEIDCAFRSAGDLHLLRNDIWCPDLNELIALKFDQSQLNGFTIKALNETSIPITDPDYAYKPVNFKKAAFASHIDGFENLTPASDILIHSEENIQINTKTGAIKAGTTSSGNYAVSNFIVFIDLYDQTDKLVSYFTFMVHLHPTITSIRLTPSSLSLVVGNPQIRFHLLAEFSDGVLANIINCPGIIWQSEKPVLKVDGENGRIYVIQSDEAIAVAEGIIKVWATMPFYLVNNGGNALATTKQDVSISASFQGDNFLQAHLLSKSTGNQMNPNTEENLNILFISEGFSASEKYDYKKIVDGILHDIKNNPTYLPWNVLPINFWSLFQPSKQSTISYYYEVIPLKNQTNELNFAWPIEYFLTRMDSYYFKAEIELDFFHSILPNRLTTAVNSSNQYLLTSLIEKIGLPTTNDISKTKLQKITEWNKLYPNSFATSGNGSLVLKAITDEVFEGWKILAKRTFTNQKDTNLGISYGSVTSYENRVNVAGHEINLSRGISDKSERVNRKALNKMLLNLRASHDNNLIIGPLWTTPDEDMLTDTNFGKDFPNIVIIAKGVSSGGSNYSIKMPNWHSRHSLSIVQALFDYPLFIYNAVSGSKEISIDDSRYTFPELIINQANITEMASVAVHELSHSYRLHDEYGGSKNSNDIKPHEKTAMEAQYNLQERTSLLNGNILDGDKIKWRWKRIKKSGVTTCLPQGEASPYTVTLKVGNGAGFLQNSEVFLRKKDTYEPDGQIIEGTLSPKFKIINITGDVITIDLVNTSPFNPSHYPAQSLLCVMAEEPANQGSFLEIIPKQIRDFISANNKPLTGDCVSNENKTGIQFPTELPVNLKNIPPAALRGIKDVLRSMYRYKIVGLYSGGNGFDCNVYHPTGYCMMRNHMPLADSFILSEFCPVCRYALINQLAPDMHDRIDSIYEKYYSWLHNL